jgi:hypothetical protein
MNKQFAFASASVLVAVGALHSSKVQALTYDETICVAQAYLADEDPSKCIKSGGDSGSAGSGGSGGTGGTSGGSGGSGSVRVGPRPPADCVAPTFFFTGPIQPEKTGVSIEVQRIPKMGGVLGSTTRIDYTTTFDAVGPDGRTWTYISYSQSLPDFYQYGWEAVPPDGGKSFIYSCRESL